MTEHPKFTFDKVFDAGFDASPGRSPYKRLYTAEEVEQLQQRARAEGEAAAVTRAEVLTAQALAKIADAAKLALPTLAQAAHEHRVGSAGLALAAARKIADAAFDRFPEAPAQAALAALAREIEAVPRLVVLAAPEVLDAVHAALEATASAVGFPGQIVAKADPGLSRAAFVLDWGDGRAAFDPEAAAQRVAAALEAALAAEGLHGEALAQPQAPEADDG
jgi:flagellar assembly protein FliH